MAHATGSDVSPSGLADQQCLLPVADATGIDISPSGLAAPQCLLSVAHATGNDILPSGLHAVFQPGGRQIFAGGVSHRTESLVESPEGDTTPSTQGVAMASHHQLLYHIVFSTKERRPLLQEDKFREQTWRYMAGVASNLDGHALRVGGYFDHAHLLLRIPAKVALSDFVRQLKASTSKHINETRDGSLKFHWQDGYGAFTVSRSKTQAIIGYIDKQMDHHRTRSFQDEYLKMLADHEVEYNPQYLWE